MTEPNDPSAQLQEPAIDPPPLSENKGIVRAAMVLAIGNVLSRILGLARTLVITAFFGATGAVSAYQTAVFVPMSIFQLIVGGEMVNSSLVPVFSDYAAAKSAEKRRELWQVVTSFMSIAIFALTLFVLVVELTAPQLALLLGAGEFDEPGLHAKAVQLMRIAAPAVLFLSLASLFSGVLYALKRFTLPAFTAAVLNLTIVIFAFLGTTVDTLVWGLLVGSALQVVIQIPALSDFRRPKRIQWNHPAIRRIFILYIPIVISLGVNQLAIGFSYRLANGEGDSSIAFMGVATTLLQFPLGLVVTALSVATLPTLSQFASNAQWLPYKETLAGGIRLVVTLILPAAIGLFALAEPIIRLLFERGAFTAQDTVITALVLRAYLFGLPFAAVDQMLIFASYARKDTWRPALVGVVSIVIYSIVALLLLKPLSWLSLMVADTVKHAVHTLLMLYFLRRHLGGLSGYHIMPVVLKALFAAAATGVVAWGTSRLLLSVLPVDTLLTRISVVTIAGGVGLLLFVGISYAVDLSETKGLLTLIRSKVSNRS